MSFILEVFYGECMLCYYVNRSSIFILWNNVDVLLFNLFIEMIWDVLRGFVNCVFVCWKKFFLKLFLVENKLKLYSVLNSCYMDYKFK